MKFSRVSSPEVLEKALGDKLSALLNEGKKVLWLISGGSNIQTACHVMAALPTDNLASLTISLTDERYGEPGHAESNQLQLARAGFDQRGATFIPYLMGLPLKDTAQSVETLLKTAFEKSDIVIGLFGMGSDGHTAGILPESVASTEQEKWVIGYDGGQYKRLTLTAPALANVDVAFLGAYGKEKLTALLTLQNGNIPIEQQPAQILKKIPELFVYNDQVD